MCVYVNVCIGGHRGPERDKALAFHNLRVQSVMEMLEKSCHLEIVYSRPGRVMGTIFFF